MAVEMVDYNAAEATSVELRANAEVDELVKQLLEGERTDVDAPPAEAEPPAAPPDGKEVKFSEPEKEPKTEAAPEPPAEAPAARDAEDYDKLARSHEVLKGKYNAETRRYLSQISDLESRITELEQALEERSRATPGQAEPAEPDPEEAASWLGDDGFRAAVKIAARELVKAESESIRKSLREEHGATVAKLKAEQYLQGLDRLRPDWREANEDPGFVDWLAEFDPLFGMTRRDALKQANAAHDAPRVAGFIEAYYASTAQPAPVKTVQRPSLDSQISAARPGGSGRGQKASPDSERIISKKEFERSYDDLTRQLQMNPDDAAIQQKLAALDRAFSENRVAPA